MKPDNMAVQTTFLVLLLLLFQGLIECEEKAKTDGKDRAHIDKLLKIDKTIFSKGSKAVSVLEKLRDIYKEDIQPLEQVYKYGAQGREFLPGAEPTTSDFTVLMHGQHFRPFKGMELVSNQNLPFSRLQKYGFGFTERLQGIEMPSPLLEKVIIVDTPGIIENKRQQERGYPFNEVCQWFIEFADLIFVVFDPTKLDVGSELEELFHQLKGHEAKFRLILNKADTVNSQELMRVYGALFWSLSPLVKFVEPPRVFVGSFWPNRCKNPNLKDLFLEEENELIRDIEHIINSWVESKITSVRRHALQVKYHAHTIDAYLDTFKQNSYLFSDNKEVLNSVLTNPEKYGILNKILSGSDISKHDLPNPTEYLDFFTIHDISSFPSLSSLCPMFSECPMDKLNNAVAFRLPRLLMEYQDEKFTCTGRSGNCKKSIETKSSSTSKP